MLPRFHLSGPSRSRRPLAVLAPGALALAVTAAGCGLDDTTTGAANGPTVVVTTSVWSDIVSNVACDGLVDIETVIPVGADAHAFEPSLADRASLEGASLVVANGLRLEQGLDDTIEAAESAGTPVLRLGRHIDTIAPGLLGGTHSHDDDGDDHGTEEGHDDGDHGDHGGEDDDHDDGDDQGVDDEGEHDDDGHDDHEGGEGERDDDEHDDDGEHDDDDEGGTDGDDPHVWFDPQRVSGVLPVLAERLVADVGLDRTAVETCLKDYQTELGELDTAIAGEVAELPHERRFLVTNHAALGYFADRYGFEVVGTVSPSSSGLAESNPADLEALAQLMERTGTRTVFAETSASTDDAEALARRLGDAEVVTLFTESLSEPGGGAETYLDFLATNADRVVTALG